MRTRTKKQLNHENRHYIRAVKCHSRLWFDRRPFDEDESYFDPYDFDPDCMFFEDEIEYAQEIAVHSPFRSLTCGTTSTTLSSSDGSFSTPVYYDWGTNWEKVSKIISTPEVQESLKDSINKAKADERRYNFGYSDWDKRHTWPFLFSLDLRYNCVVRAGLKKNYLSKDLVKQLNARIAAWYSSIGKRLVKEERISLFAAEFLYERHLMTEYKSGRRLLQVIIELVRMELFKSDGPLRELLLFAPTRTNAFKPFLYKMAEMLSPPGTMLTVYESEKYSVVVDEVRNVVFDNFLYFGEQGGGCGDPDCECSNVGDIYEALDIASDGKWKDKHNPPGRTLKVQPEK